MADAQSDASARVRSYRQDQIDETIEDHEKRITDNERRWLIAKGALAALALMYGSEYGFGQLASFI